MEKNKIREFGFLQFPLCLLQGSYNDPKKALNLILVFGLVHYALKLPYKMSDVATQLYYDYCRKREMLQADLIQCLDKAIADHTILHEPEDPGFEQNKTDPDKGFVFRPDKDFVIKPIIILLEADPGLKEAAIMNYRLKIAASGTQLNIEITTYDQVIKIYSKALDIKKKYEQKYALKSDAMPSCKVAIISDFMWNDNEDIEIFRANIAIRSLQGWAKYCNPTRGMILRRMLGCMSENTLQDFIRSNEAAAATYHAYSRSTKALRYRFDKLFNCLLSRGFLKSKIYDRRISRKIFMSTSLSYDELTDIIAEVRNKKNFKKKENESVKKLGASI